MVAPISQIEVFSNASVLPNGKISLGVFPVNNSAQRSATLRGENFVKITFNYGKSIPIPAFAFIEYDGQLFFTKEIYRPEPKGNNVYEYNVKFVSFDNLLSKPQAYRRVVVGSGAEQQTWNEPDIEIVGTLQTIAEVVCESIKASAVRYEGVFADMLSKVEIVSSEVSVNSESKAFSFQGQKISQVLESVANDYEIDYWFEQVGNMTDGITKMVLHFCKYERTDIDPLVLSDKTRVNRLNPYDPVSPPNPLKPTVSGGLDECTFANEWSGVVQRITPFGSERNITRQQAILNEMFVSYGKRLRLEYDHSCTIDGTTYPHAYAVKDEDGNTIPLSVDENGAVYVPGVTTGEETIEKYDDIYPRGHFRVTHVTQRGVDTQIFTVYAIPTEERNGQYVDLTDAEIDAMQSDPNKRLFPIDIQDGQTLSLHFESGFLNGREFEVANKSAKMVWTGDGYKVDPDNVNAHWIACFEINPEGDNNDSTQVPYGNMVPRGKLDILGYEGDMFAIFNMDMPPFYKESAMNELAQKAYDEITAILSTRPEVKCKGNEEFFMRQNLCLGLRVKVTSDLFGEGTEFVSRVTNYSHSLSRPNSVDFRLCSSRVQGSISVLKGAIADQTQAVSGVQQTARSLSRRAFRDSQEMIGMLQSIIAEMMVVGVERNQFSFTMGIECLESAASPLTRKFSGLRITAGEIQHTQEPYIKDNWEGHYTVDATTLYVDKNNHSIGTDATEEIRNTPYYLYAVIDGATGKASMELWAEKKDGENDEAYLLLGILSSEFLDGTTSLRVFNRSNGFTQIAGGTITTEQLQDPTRQLIIDMSSNPPRIIASNGAEIIGNIKFKSSDTMTAEEQLEALGLGVNEAKGAAEDAVNAAADAKQSADNAQATADGIKWIVIKNYGDADVSYVSNISVKTFTHKIYEVLPAGTYRAQLGSENPGVVSSSVGFSSSSLMIVKSGKSVDTSNILMIVNWDEEFTITENVDIHVLLCQKDYYSSTKRFPYSGTWNLKGIRVLTLTTQSISALDYLKAALTDGSTEIAGGLTMTNVLMLKNLQGAVTAGMSGLTQLPTDSSKSENVLLWGGGTYEDAYNAAESAEYYKKGSTTPITTLLKKDGTGKIGVFYIDDDRVFVKTAYGSVIIDDNDGMKILDENNNEKVLVTPKSLDINELAANTDYISSIVQNDLTIPSLEIIDPDRVYKYYGKQLLKRSAESGKELCVKNLVVTITDATANVSSFTERPYSFTIEMTVSVGDDSVTSSYNYVSEYQIKDIHGNVVQEIPSTISGSKICRLNTSQTKKYSLDTEKQISVSIRISSNYCTVKKPHVNITCDECYVLETPAKTVVGRNGFFSMVDSNNLYAVINNENKQEVYCLGLPKSKTGLKQGRLWQNGSQLCIIE